MNNRKPKNKRGAITRAQHYQFAPQPEKIRFWLGEGDDKELIVIDNPKFPGIRRIVHTTMSKGTI